ncbi:MAG: class I SAM-dependent methyltransferase [Thermodesulfobacteriota bacterium]
MNRPFREDRQRWFTKFRAEWFRVMRPEGSWVPWELRDHVQLEETDEDPSYWGAGVLQPAPQLREKHLRNCIVVPERAVLLERLPKGGVVAEVGTLHGEFAHQILHIVEPRELHLIDHEIQPTVRKMADDPSLRRRLHIHHRDSVEALDSFTDQYFDWIYIDAQHTYDGVKRDIGAACRKIKSDGLLIFNDYTVWSYVEMQPYGVVAAVNELCIEDGWEILYLTLPSHMYCDVGVRRMTRKD